MIPEWVKKYKGNGMTVKAIGNNYYLYYATSKYDNAKSYPVSVQTYIGKITKAGVVSERFSINVGKTEAVTLGELIDGLPGHLSAVIVLKTKNTWYYTKTDGKITKELIERGLYKDGKVVFPSV